MDRCGLNYNPDTARLEWRCTENPGADLSQDTALSLRQGYIPSPQFPTQRAPETTQSPLITQLNKLQAESVKSFESNVQRQGFIGSTFDYLKNHIGASSQGLAWYNPQALWSRVFDYDAGSDATRSRMQAVGANLSDAQQQLANGNIAGANRLMAGTLDLDKRTFKSAEEAKSYDDSQRDGVNLLSDVMALSVAARLAPASNIFMSTLGAAGLGGLTKKYSKQIDGGYASDSDLISGYMIGAAPVLGRYLGIAAAELSPATRVALNPATATFSPFGSFGNLAGTIVESASITSMLNGTGEFQRQFHNGLRGTDALSASLPAFINGAEAGAILGPLFALPLQSAGRSMITGSRASTDLSLPVIGSNAATIAPELRQAMLDAGPISGSDFSSALTRNVNDVLRKYEIPPVDSIKVNARRKILVAGQYSSGNASVEIFGADRGGLVPVLGHELEHHGQTVLEIRRAADIMNLGREFSQEDVAALGVKLKELTKSNYLPKLIEDTLKARNGVQLTTAETARANMIINANKNYIGGNILTYPIYRLNGMEREAFPAGFKIWQYQAPYNTEYLLPAAVLADVPVLPQKKNSQAP